MNTRQFSWLVGGFVLAPFIAALTTVLTSFLTSNNRGGDLNDAFLAIFIVYVISAPIILIIGVPCLALAHKLKMVRWWLAAIVGALAGCFFRIIMQFNQMNIAWFQQSWDELIGFALIGSSSAIFVWCCWYFAYGREPQHGT